MGNIVVLKNYQLINEPGFHHRIICMTGEKRGDIYYIKSNRIILGRNKKADITIYDSQSSREHAEVVKVDNQYFITDLKSHNGLTVNGRRVKQAKLKTKDRIVIGKTVYKYEIIEVTSENSKNNELEKREITPAEQEGLGTVKEKNKKKPVVIALTVVIILFIMMGGGENSIEKKPLLGGDKKNLLSNLLLKSKKKDRDKKDQEISKENIAIQKGIREMREGNYQRAIREFDLALLSSSHSKRALAYKKKAQDLMDEEIERYFDQAARDFESFYHTRALKSYCQIVKILEDRPEDERYKSAQENIDYIINQSRINKNEARCQ